MVYVSLISLKHALCSTNLLYQGGSVCPEHTQASDKATRHREQSVQDGESEDEQRNHHCQGCDTFLGASDGYDRQDITDHQAPRITQKDRCRIEVVREKAEQGAQQNDEQHLLCIAAQEKNDGNRSGSDASQTGSQPVQAIDEIEGIRNAHDPYKREWQCQGAQGDATATEQGGLLDHNATPHSDAGGNPLHDELHPRWNWSEIIPHT